MRNNLYQYFAIYKPFGMLSQFTKEGDNRTLGELYDFPKDVYPVGRLDTDSEGLLILTNDPSLNKKLLDPTNAHPRTYLAQVEGEITDEALEELRKGVTIRIKKNEHQTRPAKARRIPEPSFLPERTPPIRFRKNVPTSWVELILTEGKNRQARRMTAKVGFPTLRLVRYAVGELNIRDTGLVEDPVIQLERQHIT